MEYYLDGLYDFRKLNLLAVRALPVVEELAAGNSDAKEAIDIVRDLRLVDNMASLEARATGLLVIFSRVLFGGSVKNGPNLMPVAYLFHEVHDLMMYEDPTMIGA